MAHHNRAIGNLVKPLLLAFWATSMAAFVVLATPAHALNLANNPLFVTESQPPAVMLTMARDHKLFYEAYNDYSDLNGDGTLDVGYKPNVIDYYGYFDSHKCYTYASDLFSPAEVTTTKKCTGKWSGDFLNYVTTSRMDALRKVFYGGKRSTDSSTQTILERAFIPQDAHSWGKEYQSNARDGYDISEYTPLSLPAYGRYHLFANVTLTGVGSAPLMRVLENSKFRVWEWLSIERPVAGDDCATGNNTRSNCVTASTTTAGYSVVPSGSFKNLQIATYNTHSESSYPANHSEFNTFKTTYAIPGNLFGQKALANIDCKDSSCNPNSAQQDQYLTIITGKITVPADQTYSFSVDGDDAVEVIIDGTVVAGYYGAHSFCGCDTNSGSITLTAGDHDIEFRQQERTGNDGYRLRWQAAAVTAQRTDYTVRVEVCNSSIGLEANCTGYGSSPVTYKPTGILQNYGSNNGIYFGMLSGSYAANTDGGVLRKNITSDSLKPGATGSEINSNGTFSGTNGIIATMNKLRIVGFRYSAQDYEGTEGGTRYYNCGWITTRQMNPGECQMWGNPIGEMVYEAIRYFSGKTSATASFVANPGGNSNTDDFLVLPNPTWKDPYVATPTGGGLPWCAKPYVMAVSDVYPSFDSDSVPGTPFNSFTSDLSGVDLNVTTLGQKMWDTEFGGSRNVFIGQSTTSNFDSGPTAKDATTFGTLRGLAPGDPTRQGSFSSAELAYWGHMNNLSGDATKVRNLNFYSVALAPPLPKIEVPIGSSGQKVVIVPYAKSVGGSSISAVQGDFQPTNQIVDFYVDSIVNAPGAPTDATVNGGRAQYVFRINYEDVEQGADHDMDAIATYTVKLNADNTVTVEQSSDYAAGGIIQHMGYVISGTSADGIYLNVRDADTAVASDPDYFLDTPRHPSDGLPLASIRTFTPSTSSSSALLLNDPLWYAAKWGSFKFPRDASDNELPADGTLRVPPDVASWDANVAGGDGVPDNYFLVVNPLRLEQQLKKALDKILAESGTAAALATNSSAWKQGAKLYQAKFSSDGWYGEVASKSVSADGSISTESDDWRAEEELATLGATGRKIISYDGTQALGSRGVAFSTFTSLPTAMQTSLNRNSAGTADGEGTNRLSFLRGNTVTGMRSRPKIKDSDGTDTSQINLLGDIVDSAIQYVGIPDFGYADPSYLAYRTNNNSRASMLYVGANDGFLHGFSAADGVEQIAYIPSILFRNNKLSKLTQNDYGESSNPHGYYVDGTPMIADVCACGSSGCSDNICPTPDTNWKTILVGGLNGGGQGVYALNISTPASFSETAANTVAMWEFSDADDTDTDATLQYGLGYTYSRPAVVKVCTSRDSAATSVPKPCLASRWAVIMGNGYNNSASDGYASTSGYAILYILDALDGTKIKKISTKTGSTGSPNGLPTVAVADADGDGIADYVYSGDLQGNMWKFDLTANDPVNWAVAYGTAATPLPLYIARDAIPSTQPITTAPELLSHPAGGTMVLFGTGLYLQDTDKASIAQQTFYGIRDQGSSLSTATRSDLQQQSIIADSSQIGFQTSTRNAVDWSTKKGWYMDLPNSGERVAFDPALFRKIIYFTSLAPSADVCGSGGDSWDTFLDGLTGGALDYAVFAEATAPITGTGITGTAYASRRASKVGITPQGTTIDFGQGKTEMYKGGSKQGKTEHFGVNLGSGSARREAWREIIKD